eukprot:s1857_g13.t1
MQLCLRMYHWSVSSSSSSLSLSLPLSIAACLAMYLSETQTRNPKAMVGLPKAGSRGHRFAPRSLALLLALCSEATADVTCASRSLLQKHSDVGAAAAASQAAPYSAVDVAIVGAGYAGLSIARELQKANVSFRLFEARHRIGGRILDEDLNKQGQADDVITARALFGSGPDGRGPPISDPASLRPARPASYGPAPGRNNGGRIAAAYAHGAAISDALGPEASACIAADILAIAQGVADTQADLEILRTGVSDIAECLENKIRDMWDLVEAEVKSECDHQRHIADVAHERRVSDHETLEAHFARLNSAINDRFIEFDDRIFRMNESRAGSITVQLQETMRTIKRYPDALQEVYLKISNAEARIGTVQQTATNRIEVIRTEMSRALYEHKERTDRLIADLTARVVQLECGRAHKTASDHSTPSRQDRAQFFDISDHDADIPRPIDLRRPIPDRSLFRTFGQHDSQIVIAGPDRSWLSARTKSLGANAKKYACWALAVAAADGGPEQDDLEKELEAEIEARLDVLVIQFGAFLSQCVVCQGLGETNDEEDYARQAGSSRDPPAHVAEAAQCADDDDKKPVEKAAQCADDDDKKPVEKVVVEASPALQAYRLFCGAAKRDGYSFAAASELWKISSVKAMFSETKPKK